MAANVTLFVTGKKGFGVIPFVIGRAHGLVDFVVVGRDVGVEDDCFFAICELLDQHSIKWYPRDDYPPLDPKSYVIAVGWRWLIDHDSDRLIVLHDSLLPKYRGFAPLINMLINGEKEIGVTALFGSENYDSGAIISQSSTKICYPITIAEAIDINNQNYVRLLSLICSKISQGQMIEGSPQVDTEATYSIWRDQDDYVVDWSKSAQEISRFVDAVGDPYSGAISYTSLGDVLRIAKVKVVNDVRCEQRHTGKVIFVQNGEPVVICGSGLLRISKAFKLVDGKEISCIPLQHFRTRFISCPVKCF